MYNRLLLWVLLLCSSGTTEIYGQAGLFDNLWLFGKRSTPFEPRIGGSQIDFSVSPPDTSTVEIPGNLDLLQMAVACDSSGRLIAYTNGCSIVDHTHQIMAGGDTINPGPYFLSNCVTYGAYALGQSLLFLPLPNADSIYYLFHLRYSDNNYSLTDLLYTVINSKGNGGRGEVQIKNQLLLRDRLSDQLTAVRHANGRDWWIMVPQGVDMTRRYFTRPADSGGSSRSF